MRNIFSKILILSMVVSVLFVSLNTNKVLANTSTGTIEELQDKLIEYDDASSEDLVLTNEEFEKLALAEGNYEALNSIEHEYKNPR